MHLESDIRLMIKHLRDIEQKYKALKEQAAERRDSDAERAAFISEFGYGSQATILEWAVGDREALIAVQDMPARRPDTA